MAREDTGSGRTGLRDAAGVPVRGGTQAVGEDPAGSRPAAATAAPRLERDGNYSIGFDLAPARGQPGPAAGLRDAVPLESGTIPVLSEELAVERRAHVTGGVRLHRRVSERVAEVDEPVVRERVVVERVPIDEPITDGRIPQVHEREDGVLVVPVLEEILVVQKRLVLREELHVRRVREETRERQSVPLQREHVEVERFDANGRPVDRTTDH